LTGRRWSVIPSASTFTCCWGGQVRGQKPNLYLIYPQGNPLAATEDSLYLQLGECKYGRPILDRGIQSTTSLEVAAKYALLSLDATMRSNVTVGPPFDLLLYKKDSLQITRYRRVSAGDRDLNLIHSTWEQSLRRAVEQLPDIEFQSSGSENPAQSIREVARSRV
jgi:putative proteasome-type protease